MDKSRMLELAGLVESSNETEIQIDGYGKLLPSQIKKKVQAMVNDIAAELDKERPDWNKIEFMLKKDTMLSFVATMKRHYKEMN